MATFSSTHHQFVVLPSKCPSDMYQLAITARTSPLDSTYVYKNTLIGNTHQLTFDLITPYYFRRAVSIAPRIL